MHSSLPGDYVVGTVEADGRECLITWLVFRPERVKHIQSGNPEMMDLLLHPSRRFRLH